MLHRHTGVDCRPKQCVGRADLSFLVVYPMLVTTVVNLLARPMLHPFIAAFAPSEVREGQRAEKMDSLVNSLRMSSGVKGDTVDKAHKTLDDVRKLDTKAHAAGSERERDLESDGESSISEQAADDLLALTLGLGTSSSKKSGRAGAKAAASGGPRSKADKQPTPSKTPSARSLGPKETENKRPPPSGQEDAKAIQPDAVLQGLQFFEKEKAVQSIASKLLAEPFNILLWEAADKKTNCLKAKEIRDAATESKKDCSQTKQTSGSELL